MLVVQLVAIGVIPGARFVLREVKGLDVSSFKNVRAPAWRKTVCGKIRYPSLRVVCGAAHGFTFALDSATIVDGRSNCL